MSRMKFPATRMKTAFMKSFYCLAVGLVLLLTACATSTQTTTTTTTTGTTTTSAHQPGDYGLAALPGYQVSLFVHGDSSAYTGPDAIIVDNGHVFIDYQNTTAKDCTDKNSSTIVEYTMSGTVVKTFSVPGHSDGMRADPSTHLLWVTSCEDGNAKFVTIDANSGTITPYTIPPSPHGGGYDDMFFVNGMAFIAASNPTLDTNGNNVFPALDKITLGNGKVNLTPVLMGNASATDLITNTKVTLNEVDPDSMTVDSKGNLILINQGGNEIVYLTNPGTPQQKVSRLSVGSQLDDTVWATSTQGRLLVSDGTTNNTYWISTSNFTPGTIYTELPDDSGVAGLVGVVSPSTGIVSGVAIGFGKPTGMLFVPNS